MIVSMKNSIVTIGNRTRDLPVETQCLNQLHRGLPLKASKLTEISFSKLSFRSLQSFKILGCATICLHLVFSKHLGYSEFDAVGSGLQQLESDMTLSQRGVFFSFVIY